MNSGAGEGGSFGVFVADVGGEADAVAEFPVDLNDERNNKKRRDIMYLFNLLIMLLLHNNC